MKVKISRLAIYLVSYSFGLIWLLPIIGVLMASIRPFPEILHGWWVFDKFNPTLQNYINAWNHESFPIKPGIFNSLLVCIPSTILPIFIASFAAYGFARFKFYFKEHIFLLILILMATPAQMIAISVYKLYLKTGLLNTFIGLIFLHTGVGSIWIMFFMRNFFNSLPVEIEEAAKVDGASDFTIFRQIVLPMSIPALTSAAILQFVWVWNDFFFAIVTLFDTGKFIATQRVPLLRGTYFINYSLLSAGSTIVMLIPVVVFIFMHKYFFKGLIGWAIEK